jgi:hypothetical protein
MDHKEMHRHMEAIREYIRKATTDCRGGELAVKRRQLTVIRRSIHEMEKAGIPIPRRLMSESASLEAQTAKGTTCGCPALYEALLEIIEEAGRACGRKPYRDLCVRFKEWKQKTTSPAALRQAISEALKELGGSGNEGDVLAKAELKLKGKFTPADLQRVRGGSYRWQLNARWESRRMVNDGILEPVLRRGLWKLAK